MKTLYAKLSLALTVLLFTIGIGYFLVTLSGTRHYVEEMNQRLNRDLARNLVADRNLVAEGRINQQAVKETFHEYMTINPSIEIYLLDLEGKILAFSADPDKVKRRQVSLGPIHDFLSPDLQLPLLGDDPRSHDRRKSFSVTSVPSDEAPQGYLYVVLRGSEFDTVDALLGESYFLRSSGLTLLISLAVGLVAGLLIFHVLTSRLRRLTALFDRFRHSGFSRHDAYAAERHNLPGDEIDHLGTTFDEMAQRIIDQFESLNQKDALRRELVAHVSHDLRTPLASLHGYLETLKLKDQSLSDTDRRNYLDVAISHSERLTRLVADLFELATLDAKEQNPVLEPFAAAELVQDVSQKFQLKADNKDTRLHVDAQTDLPLASGDIALMERVLENLIDNALNHTPAGGTVKIPVWHQHGKVCISVCDSGDGIPAQDLPRIFDSFYQSDNPHRGSGHARLGLAIAKRILDLHSSELVVDSTVGVGTTFHFDLPVSITNQPTATILPDAGVSTRQ